MSDINLLIHIEQGNRKQGAQSLSHFLSLQKVQVEGISFCDGKKKKKKTLYYQKLLSSLVAIVSELQGALHFDSVSWLLISGFLHFSFAGS